jgi:hypothetical protein
MLIFEKAVTCSHLQSLAAAWAGGCKWLQVAASDCFFEDQNDARLLAVWKY